MSVSPLINIRNLSCSYSRKEADRVLFIENLTLEKGKVIFLLGASGSGKSTLLETLGLMNHTIASGSVEIIGNDQKPHDFSKLWESNNLDQINKIRKDFLSFIFQNTNLMENFTAYENICLSQMIKHNARQEEAMSGAVEIMKQVGLTQNLVNFDTVSVNLSGGQRQRVSFVRALNTDFKVLLCDEPTGNLDEVNANELLNIVRQNINNEKTAILVSHDVNLALRYADQIILITKNNEKGYGEVLAKNVFKRDYWTSLNEKEYNNFRESIVSLFAKGKEEGQSEQKVQATFKGTDTYKKLFIKKEGRVLFGKSFVNLFILISIISITLLSIGFANGALKYLDIKLNDAFVNWLTVPIPWAKSGSDYVEEFTDQLNADSIRNKFLIDTVIAYKETSLLLYNSETNESEAIKGRLVVEGDPIKEDLFGSKNFVSGARDFFFDDDDLGIVVTEKLLNRLKYPPDTKVIYLDNEIKDTLSNPPAFFKIPVPVRAVIKDLPNREYFLITNYFYSASVTHHESVFDYTADQCKRIIFFIDGDKALGKKLKAEIEEKIKSGGFSLTETYVEQPVLSEDDYEEDSEMEERLAETVPDSLIPPPEVKTRELSLDVSEDSCEYFSTPGRELSVSFDSKPYHYGMTENLYQKIMELPSFKINKAKIIRILDYNIGSSGEKEYKNDYLCINFKAGGLDKIEDLAKFVSKNSTFNSGEEGQASNIMEVDAGTVKEKKNFDYISKMTRLISTLLIIFSILAISLFISNLLKTHLNKVKMNIGTYKAFGLSDKESKSIYLEIMLRFIVIGLTISFIIAYIIGSLIGKWFESNLRIEDQAQYFLLFANQTYILLAIIILVTIMVSYFNINRILSKTPGDLIYNR